MRRLRQITCLWPGVARLWYRGQWSGLFAAAGFALLLNTLIAGTLLWPEIAPPSIQAAGLSTAALWWLVAGLLALRELPEISTENGPDSQQGLFISAQREYLKGNWIEAEAHLRKLLRRRPRDVESLLLLATMQRRTRRYDDARQQLQQIARLEAAVSWQTEIRSEREILRREVQRRRMKEIEEVSEQPPSVFAMTATEEVSTNAEENDNTDHRRAA